MTARTRGGGLLADRVGGGGLPTGGQGSKFMWCVRNPRNINVFDRVPGREESGSRPGGSVTGVTEKLFMCQMFMSNYVPFPAPKKEVHTVLPRKGRLILCALGLWESWVAIQTAC